MHVTNYCSLEQYYMFIISTSNVSFSDRLSVNEHNEGRFLISQVQEKFKKRAMPYP